jgi:nucleoside-diphosphate-sugar epimerase
MMVEKMNWKKKTVLVTGASGFVGSCLAHRLVETGCSLNLILRNPEKSWRLSPILEKSNLFKHRVDLTDLEKLKKTIDEISPDVIYHLATYGAYPGIQKDLGEMMRTNVIGTLNLVTACAKKSFSCFINTGTSSEYGMKEHRITETDLLEPMTYYGVSKAAATLFCQTFAKNENMPIATFRLFSPYGENEEKSRLFPTVILSCLLDKPLHLSSPLSVRDFIYIEDAVDAYLLSAGSPSAISGQVLNIASGEQHTVGEVVDAVIAITKSKIRPQWGTEQKKQPEPTTWVADISKAKKLLGWAPKNNFKTGVEKTVSWFRQNLGIYESRETR